MRLSDVIVSYRTENNISQRAFASKCGLTNGYISMLENGKNPRTGKPITPTIDNLKRLADAMGITLHALMSQVDDMPISLASESEYVSDNTQSLSDRAISIAEIYDSLNSDGKELVDAAIHYASRYKVKSM